ncbi:MAG TPA: hypothetical protein EYP59_06775 [Thiotrichaceae bacterium]|nr:hypothetical protein [Thiotrichaceae bacterium]
MLIRRVLTVMALIVAFAPGCSKDPLSGRVKELEERVNTLETSAEEQRQMLLERLNSIEVTAENAQEIAEIAQKLQKPELTATDITQLEVRIAQLEQIYVDWSSVNSRLAYAVYAVLWGLSLPNGDYEVSFIGTAFAVDDTKLLTNAHIIDALVKWDEELWAFNDTYKTTLFSDWLVVRNKTTRLYYKYNYYYIWWYRTHTDWNPDDLESPDVGYLKIRESRIYLKATLASDSEVYRLKEGQRIATLGFPGELQGGILDNLYPIATFKDGTISAIRPWFPGLTSIADKYIIQHNLDLSGGTSGSPIYNTAGKVIAVNNAGIDVAVFTIGGAPTTVSQAALGFGIRIDKANELLSMASKPVALEAHGKEETIELLEGRDIRTLKWSKPSTILKKLAKLYKEK